MNEKYLVIGSGMKDGNAYSTLKRIVEGKKDNGDRYAFIDEKSYKREVEELPIGSIYEYASTRITPKATTPTPPAQQPTKAMPTKTL
ncbi:MAG: hypothetical protein FWB91_04595 [Defluviitaleaceae bacterium]|nr:hypothetical protein [Defluviitaleaceae bacterium]